MLDESNLKRLPLSVALAVIANVAYPDLIDSNDDVVVKGGIVKVTDQSGDSVWHYRGYHAREARQSYTKYYTGSHRTGYGFDKLSQFKKWVDAKIASKAAGEQS